MGKTIRKILITLYVIIISIAFVLCIVYGPQITAYCNPTPTRLPRENLSIIGVSPENVRVNNGYYNVSVPITNFGPITVQLQKFYVYPYEDTLPLNRTIPDMTLFFNGTALNPSQLDYTLETGDHIVVNFLIPSAEYTPNSNMSLTVYTTQDLYYQEFALNWIP